MDAVYYYINYPDASGSVCHLKETTQVSVISTLTQCIEVSTALRSELIMGSEL